MSNRTTVKQYYCITSKRIKEYQRIIPAVRKHIVPQEALAGAGVAVGVEEALDNGVVISALEVIEAGFYDGEVAIYEVKKQGPKVAKTEERRPLQVIEYRRQSAV